MNPFAAMRAKYDAAHPKEAPVLTKDTDPTGVPHWHGTAPVTQEYSRAAEKVVNTAPQTVGKETHDASVGVLHNWYVKAPDGTQKEFASVAAAQAYRQSLHPEQIPDTSSPEPVPVVQMQSQPAAPVAQPVKEPVMATAPVTPAPKETIGQDIGNFFKKLLNGVEKGFAFVDKIEVAAQPVIEAIDAGIAPLDPPLAAAIAAGDGLVNGIFSVTGSVLNTITTVGATNATPAQKMAAALPAIEQEILSDPTLAGAIKAVGGTPTNIAQFNAAMTAAAQALYLLTTAI